ncbi:MAG: hypothetical protein M5T61_04030 [Acidimicrobiia bacterium]|nr:hypothetical protein [Acidimicrobiia bacterium]
MKLDGATVLLQWAAGGLLGGWITTRRREVGLGYGWLLRSVFGAMALSSAVLFASRDGAAARSRSREQRSARWVPWSRFAVSVARRSQGVRVQSVERSRRRARVRAMLAAGEPESPPPAEEAPRSEFPPLLDLVAPVGGFVGLLGAASLAGGPFGTAAARLVAGAAFSGALIDAMLLGHWYLVQPGLRRDPLREMVALAAALWVPAVAAFVWPTGMVQVIGGGVDDGFGGLLGWAWVLVAVSTPLLIGAAWLALRERAYSAVMAATGLLYLAILTGLGSDLVARAALAP